MIAHADLKSSTSSTATNILAHTVQIQDGPATASKFCKFNLQKTDICRVRGFAASTYQLSDQICLQENQQTTEFIEQILQHLEQIPWMRSPSTARLCNALHLSSVSIISEQYRRGHLLLLEQGSLTLSPNLQISISCNEHRKDIFRRSVDLRQFVASSLKDAAKYLLLLCSCLCGIQVILQ